MSQDEMHRFMAELKTNTELREALSGAKTAEAVAQVVAVHGYSIPPEDVKQLQADHSAEELDLGMLDKVAGGYSCSVYCLGQKLEYSCSPNC